MKHLRVIPCDPFQLGWEKYSVPATDFRDNFELTHEQAHARQDLNLAGFGAVPSGPKRFLPGEALYWSVLLVNTGTHPQALALRVEAGGARAYAWYQHPWYTAGRGVLATERRMLVPELLLKHDQIQASPDLTDIQDGLPDHADPHAEIRLQLRPGGFAKCLIKAVTREAHPVRGRLLTGTGETLFSFVADPVPGPALEADAVWRGLYYGLIPGSSSPRYGIAPALFSRDLAYLEELGINALMVNQAEPTDAVLAELARHGIRKLILKSDDPESIRRAVAACRQAGIKPWFYTEDEPHHSREALREHLRRARRVRAGDGKSATAISLALDKLPYVRQSLDLPIYPVWSLTGALDARGLYYWQSAFERPLVNRYLAGLFGHFIGARGCMPFVFRDGLPAGDWASAFREDASPLYGFRLRHHLMAYPGRTGPIRTIQAEALHQGFSDWRVLQAAKQAVPDGFRILMRQLAPFLSGTMAPGVLAALYNGREEASLAPGPLDEALLIRAREKALDLLAHARGRKTAFAGVVDPASVHVGFDPASNRLCVQPAGARIENFPLCLIEGFAADATTESIAHAIFGCAPDDVVSWTLTSG